MLNKIACRAVKLGKPLSLIEAALLALAGAALVLAPLAVVAHEYADGVLVDLDHDHHRHNHLDHHLHHLHHHACEATACFGDGEGDHEHHHDAFDCGLCQIAQSHVKALSAAAGSVAPPERYFIGRLADMQRAIALQSGLYKKSRAPPHA